MRFSDWLTFDDIAEQVPKEPGLFQIKTREGLLSYPRGKSAMFYYGYSEDLNYGLQKFSRDILPPLKMTPETLFARWMAAEDFEIRFKNQLDLFRSNFGSFPLGNEMLLQQETGEQADPEN
ncbi:hypothetical protein IIA28_03640 [candidate division KSB1 bacterium]|nr:hypothetical protein [candidate division KSB1 bacterium]